MFYTSLQLEGTGRNSLEKNSKPVNHPTQVENRLDDAISNYKKLLETDFVSQISPDHPGYKMRYVALKN